jgi:hypothetical protein
VSAIDLGVQFRDTAKEMRANTAARFRAKSTRAACPVAWMLLLALVVGPLSTSAVAQQLPRSVLAIDATTPNTSYFIGVHKAFNAAINDVSASSIYVYVESLNLRDFASAQYFNELSRFFREKYRDKPIGVIVAYNALALTFVLKWRDKIWPGVPVVFTGVDDRTIDGLTLPADVTGLPVRHRLNDMVLLGISLAPRDTGSILLKKCPL